MKTKEGSTAIDPDHRELDGKGAVQKTTKEKPHRATTKAGWEAGENSRAFHPESIPKRFLTGHRL